MKPTKISREEKQKIVEEKKPIGFFWTRNTRMFKTCYQGIDNSTGDAWVEEFDTYEEMIEWMYAGFKEEKKEVN